MSIDTQKRDEYWNSFTASNLPDEILYHAAGADRNIEEKPLAKSQMLLLWYRFLLEEKLLTHLVQQHVPSPERVLDYGCGTGRFSVLLAKYFDAVDAIDISRPFIEACQDKYSKISNIQFQVGTIESVPTDAQYDLIHVGGVFMCMSDEEFAAALDRMRTLLRPEGVLLVRDTLAKKETVAVDQTKVYRSEAAYERFFERDFTSFGKYSGANRNLFCSLYMRFPKIMQENAFVFAISKLLVKCCIGIDTQRVIRRVGHRHALADQLYYVFKRK